MTEKQSTGVISGERLLGLFENLHNDRTVLNIRLTATDYERLTIITDIRIKDSVPHFLIDYPSGFESRVAGLDEWPLRFEFTGKDKIPYAFETSGGEISNGEVWIGFPESVERTQRREYFRLEAPLGTKIRVRRNNEKHVVYVINVSEGGLLVCFERGSRKEPVFKAGETLKDLVLVFPTTYEGLKVKINEARVTRVEKEPREGRYRYTLQYTKIDSSQQDYLRNLIFRFQREFLRKR